MQRKILVSRFLGPITDQFMWIVLQNLVGFHMHREVNRVHFMALIAVWNTASTVSHRCTCTLPYNRV